jgi:hypothetical protein
MIIDKVKIFRDTITVDFSNYHEAFRISTEDTPKTDLLASAQNVVHAALVLHGLDNIRCQFHTVEISSGDEPGARLTLSMRTQTDGYARIILPKISTDQLIDWKNGGVPKVCPQNDFISVFEFFLQFVKEFVHGKRMQMALPFDGVEEREEEEKPSGLHAIAADRVLEFR